MYVRKENGVFFRVMYFSFINGSRLRLLFSLHVNMKGVFLQSAGNNAFWMSFLWRLRVKRSRDLKVFILIGFMVLHMSRCRAMLKQVLKCLPLPFQNTKKSLCLQSMYQKKKKKKRPSRAVGLKQSFGMAMKKILGFVLSW